MCASLPPCWWCHTTVKVHVYKRVLVYLHVGDVTRRLKYMSINVLAYLHVGDVTQRLKYMSINVC